MSGWLLVRRSCAAAAAAAAVVFVGRSETAAPVDGSPPTGAGYDAVVEDEIAVDTH